MWPRTAFGGKRVANPNLYRETTCEGQLSICLRHEPLMCQLMTPCLLDVTIIAHYVDVIFVTYKRERELSRDIMTRFWWQYLKSDVNTLKMLIDGARRFSTPANYEYIGLQIRGSFITVLKKLGIHPLALSLNAKNAVLTSATVHLRARASLSAIWRSHDSDSFSLSICKCLVP